MNKKNTILIIVVAVTLITVIGIATYAYFATGLLNISNVVNANTVTERNNMFFVTLGGNMSLDITVASMQKANSNNVAAENNTTLTVNFTANTEYSMVCSYDIVYEWTSTDKYQAHSSGVTGNEFTIQAALASNEHVSEGTNNIHNETDLSVAVGNQNSATIIQGAQIDSTGTSTSTAVWTLTSKFYNVNADQSTLSGKTYAGRFKVANVSCVAGTASGSSTSAMSYWFDTSVCTSSNPCTYPAYGGTLQTNGSATGHNVYIGQDSSKYYVCATIQGHEVCLSQPYTQYTTSLFGGTINADQQIAGKQSIYQVFTDAGVIIDMDDNCTASDFVIRCSVGDFGCDINYIGNVVCWDDDIEDTCYVNSGGKAYCRQ